MLGFLLYYQSVWLWPPQIHRSCWLLNADDQLAWIMNETRQDQKLIVLPNCVNTLHNLKTIDSQLLFEP